MGVTAVFATAWACAVWLPSVAWIDSAPSASETAVPQGDGEAQGEGNLIVQLASADLARRIGIETAAVTRQKHAQNLDANAETAYNGQRTAEVLARVSGVVREVRVELNQVVRRGDLLAVVDSAAVGSAKAQYLTALATVKLAEVTYERYHALAEKQIAAGKNELEALTALTHARTGLLEAKQHLFNFGFAQADLDAIQRDESASNLLDVVAPIAGSVTTWDAALGEAVEPTTQLFAISDTSQFWLWIDVYESDIASVEVGQPVTFRISNTDVPVFAGRITAIGTEADRTTRTTRVRAQIANNNGRLRANVFGRARIEITPEHEAITVPTAAVQHDGKQEIVFLPERPGRYRRQTVVTKPMDEDGLSEVVDGLETGQQVVTTGSFLLYSEMVKDRIAGDVD
ncbi:MAG: efflux RND transporter periplasmic adaptor subunit [Planctomycetia bacterium]|nr:efflux RND transporter periplasmic adaptor subunit [Planctomycetia bacterium]